MNDMRQQRIHQLQYKMRQEKVDRFLLIDTTSIDYLIGHRFHPGERFLGLLVSQNETPILFLNRLFPCEQSELFSVVDISDGDDIIALLGQYLQGNQAIDDHLPAAIVLPLIAKVPSLQVGSYLVNELRLIKDQEEQNRMRAASKCNDEVMAEVEALLHVGVSDLEVEDQIHAIHRRLGVTASFPPIVAFQQTASDPHGSANGQTLQQNDCVVIDMGLVLDDYCSDMTRTFLFGETKMKDIYEVVRQANLAAIACVAPGVRFCDIDEAARSVIADAGYGQYFTHRTGHGIGLDVHEPMDVGPANEAIVKEGMCFSIEPGIYLPGVGGVRIEDLVLVSEHGAEVLNAYPK